MKKNILYENQYKYAMQGILMKLYSQYGYRQVAIPACEPQISAVNEATSQVKFMDQSGTIFYLQNDPTFSVMNMLKYSQDSAFTEKVCYYAPTYKWGHRKLSEETQIGIEVFGNDNISHDIEIILLAVKSLLSFTPAVIVDIGDITLLNELIKLLNLNTTQRESLIKALPTKNMRGLKALDEFSGLNETKWKAIAQLFRLYGYPEKVMNDTKLYLSLLNTSLEESFKVKKLFESIEKRNLLLKAYGILEYIRLDFTLKPELEYYNGIVLKGFIKECPSEVLTGGRYDELIKQFSTSQSAAGFALNLDLIMTYTEVKAMTRKNSLLLLENELTEKGITYAEAYRQKGFEVNLRTFSEEKDAIDMASKENFEKVIVFNDDTAKVIDIRKNAVQKLTYTALDRYMEIKDLERGIH